MPCSTATILTRDVTCNLKNEEQNIKADSYKYFKYLILTLGLIGLILIGIILIWTIKESIGVKELTGSAKAQSEFFLMPMFFYGGTIGLISGLLILINGLADWIKKYKNQKLNSYIYTSLGINIAIPILTLIIFMYM